MNIFVHKDIHSTMAYQLGSTFFVRHLNSENCLTCKKIDNEKAGELFCDLSYPGALLQ